MREREEEREKEKKEKKKEKKKRERKKRRAKRDEKREEGDIVEKRGGRVSGRDRDGEGGRERATRGFPSLSLVSFKLCCGELKLKPSRDGSMPIRQQLLAASLPMRARVRSHACKKMGRVVGLVCSSGGTGARAESYGGAERGRPCLPGQGGRRGGS